MLVTFIFVIDIGLGLGCAGSKLFYDSIETLGIVSICDGFVKLSCGLIGDAQYMTL
jgi:hypothetical protein